jgi:hypothetical protein
VSRGVDLYYCCLECREEVGDRGRAVVAGEWVRPQEGGCSASGGGDGDGRGVFWYVGFRNGGFARMVRFGYDVGEVGGLGFDGEEGGYDE